MTAVSERITTARIAKRLNQSEVARLLNLSPQAVQSWESGKAAPRSQTLIDLSEILGVSVGYILGDDSANPSEDSKGEDASASNKVKVVDNAYLLTGEIRKTLGYQILPASELKSRGVKVGDAICVVIEGNGMMPIMPHGTIACIDQGNTTVVDGSVYAVAQQGELRIKLVYKTPGGGLRFNSYNRGEHPEETYLQDEIKQKGIEIKGKLIWMSHFLP